MALAYVILLRALCRCILVLQALLREYQAADGALDAAIGSASAAAGAAAKLGVPGWAVAMHVRGQPHRPT